ncbi:hypothetical protein ACFLV3_01680 [Chloroflexota bacterium]
MSEDNAKTTHNSLALLPTVGSSYQYGWQQIKKYFLELLLIAVIGIVIGVPLGIFNNDANEGGAGAAILGVFGFAYSILVIKPVDYGISFANLRAARGDKLEVKDMFDAFKYYINVVLASLLSGAIIVIGLVLLIVPGIIFACKLAFVPYLVMDRKMEAIEAVKESWRMTNGYASKVFLIGLLAIPICIAGLICFGVGIIFAFMWIRLAFASLYHAVSVPGQNSG